MDADFDSYNNNNNNNNTIGPASKRSTRARTDEPDSHSSRRASHSQDPEQEQEREQEREQEQEQEQEQDDINEVEEVTRCICGSDDLYVPKNNQGEFDNVDPGFFIQCEICAVWQHGYCVGIKDEENAPEKYWCEQCKPENHTLFTDRFGIRRSKYDPTHEIADSTYSSSTSMNSQKKSFKRKNGRFVSSKLDNPESADDFSEVKKERKPFEIKATDNEEATEEHSNDHEISQNEEEYEDEDGHRRKHRKRSSYSYRDYNYEEMLKKALEESAKESGVVPEEVNISSSEGPGGIRETRTASLRKNRAKLHDDISLTVHENDESNPETESELLKNDDVPTGTDAETTEVKPEKVEIYKKPKIEERRRARDSKRTRPRRTTSATSASNDEHEEDNDDRLEAKSTVSTKGPNNSSNSKNTTNLNSNTNPSTPKRSSTKREKKDTKTPASEDKPFRANLPSARISMNEMTRRIFSIMDFVSNIQINLSNEEEFKNNLFKMNDSELTPEITDLKSTLIGCYNDSIDQLDQLTALLNTWQNNHA